MGSTGLINFDLLLHIIGMEKVKVLGEAHDLKGKS